MREGKRMKEGEAVRTPGERGFSRVGKGGDDELKKGDKDA
jgi:hypothetical protein